MLITPKNLRSPAPPERLDGAHLPILKDKCRAWFIREKEHRHSHEHAVATDVGLRPTPAARWDIENFTKVMIEQARRLRKAWHTHTPIVVHQQCARKMLLLSDLSKEEVGRWLRYRGYEEGGKPHKLERIDPAVQRTSTKAPPPLCQTDRKRLFPHNGPVPKKTRVHH